VDKESLIPSFDTNVAIGVDSFDIFMSKGEIG
jgi:hypothetical protein